MLGCEAYIAGNVGSGTPEEMQDWVEYMTFAGDSEMANLRRKNGRDKPWKIKYFGVGNENWGCGGNMTTEYYSDLYKRYQTYVRNYPGSRITNYNKDDTTHFSKEGARAIADLIVAELSRVVPELAGNMTCKSSCPVQKLICRQRS